MHGSLWPNSVKFMGNYNFTGAMEVRNKGQINIEDCKLRCYDTEGQLTFNLNMASL